MFMDVLLNWFTVGETVSTSMDKNAKMMIMNHYEEEQEYKNKSDDDIYIYTIFSGMNIKPYDFIGMNHYDDHYNDDHYNDDNDDGGDGQLK